MRVSGARGRAPGRRSGLGRLGSAQARALDARASGVLAGSGGLVIIAVSPLVPATVVMALTGVAALLVATWAWFTPPSAPAWRFHAYTALSMPITVLATASAEHQTALRLGPVVLAVPLLTISCLRPRREVVPQLLLAVTSYGVYLAVTLPPAAAVVGWLAGSSAGTMITLLVCHLRLAVDHLIDELRAVARRDPLTGLGNRLALREWAESHEPGGDRPGRQVAVLLVDVDRFKRINDTLGHAAGDQALVGVAEALAGTCGPDDLVVRLGGEEFVLCLPVSRELAGVRAEQVRAAVKHHVRAGHPTVTVSVGVAFGAAADLFLLLAQADQALYVAKQLGRDCVHVAREPEPDHAP